MTTERNSDCFQKPLATIFSARFGRAGWQASSQYCAGRECSSFAPRRPGSLLIVLAHSLKLHTIKS